MEKKYELESMVMNKLSEEIAQLKTEREDAAAYRQLRVIEAMEIKME